MVKHLEKAYFQMASLLDAGLPIVRSLKAVSENQISRLQRAFTFLEDRVSSGLQLNEAMAEKHRVFLPFDVTIVAAAEESGDLSTTFRMLADWYKLRVRLRRRLIGGLTLPVCVLCLAIFLGPLAFLLLGRITLEQYLKHCFGNIIWLCSIIAVIFLLAKSIPKRGIIRLPFDFLVLFIPLLRKPLYRLAISRFCRSFYMLYSAGIPITRAAELAVGLTGNQYVSRFLAGTARSVQAGRPMSDGFARDHLPVELYLLWETGEESGTLDKMSLHLAKMYDDLAEHGFKIFVFWFSKIVYVGVMIYEVLLIFRGIAAISSAAGRF